MSYSDIVTYLEPTPMERSGVVPGLVVTASRLSPLSLSVTPTPPNQPKIYGLVIGGGIEAPFLVHHLAVGRTPLSPRDSFLDAWVNPDDPRSILVSGHLDYRERPELIDLDGELLEELVGKLNLLGFYQGISQDQMMRALPLFRGSQN